MKALKIKTLSAALLLSIFAMSASAQPQQQQRRAPQGGERPTAEKIAEIATDKLDQALELTDAQESKILAINLKYAKLKEENRPEKPAKGEKGENRPEGEKPNRESMKAQMEAAKAQQKAQMGEIMKLLTDDQKVEYALFIAKTASKHNPKAPRGKQGGKQCQDNKKCESPRKQQHPRGERPAPEQPQE